MTSLIYFDQLYLLFKGGAGRAFILFLGSGSLLASSDSFESIRNLFRRGLLLFFEELLRTILPNMDQNDYLKTREN